MLLPYLYITTTSTTLALQKEVWGTVHLGVQPFVMADDVMLSHDKDSESVVVTRLYDKNHGDYSVQNEQLTLASNKHSEPVRTCETEDT